MGRWNTEKRGIDMAKRQTHLEKAIANLDEKIGALQLARQHLVEQQTAKPATKKPRAKLPDVADGGQR